MNFKEATLEEIEQTKVPNWWLNMPRVLANILTSMLLVTKACVVNLVVQSDAASLLQKNELQLFMSGTQFMFPPLFDLIGIIREKGLAGN